MGSSFCISFDYFGKLLNSIEVRRTNFTGQWSDSCFLEHECFLLNSVSIVPIVEESIILKSTTNLFGRLPALDNLQILSTKRGKNKFMSHTLTSLSSLRASCVGFSRLGRMGGEEACSHQFSEL